MNIEHFNQLLNYVKTDAEITSWSTPSKCLAGQIYHGLGFHGGQYGPGIDTIERYLDITYSDAEQMFFIGQAEKVGTTQPYSDMEDNTVEKNRLIVADMLERYQRTQKVLFDFTVGDPPVRIEDQMVIDSDEDVLDH